MASDSCWSIEVLLEKGKSLSAPYVYDQCLYKGNPQYLNYVLDYFLNPRKAIDDFDTIDWCKWLMGGTRTPDDFTKIVRKYDNATTCGLVWVPTYVAYRCRTCGISPCMSLCSDCFKNGNHQRHDYNMFLSQSGGACDCGDASVLKDSGFCSNHGPNKKDTQFPAPDDLTYIAESMMPRLLIRLVQHLREISTKELNDNGLMVSRNTFANAYVSMLMDFSSMGTLMKRVMTQALINPQVYKLLSEIPENDEVAQYMSESEKLYSTAVQEFALPEPIEDFQPCEGLQKYVKHNTLLEEVVFWTVKYEFPQTVVCLLLNLLPDLSYKESFTSALISHYSRIPLLLEEVKDPDTVSNRVVHVTVQLFSNESLAIRMNERHNLLLIIIVSLKYMMSKTITSDGVINCSSRILTDHCYWPLVSDFNNLLGHRPLALKFMEDDLLLKRWFSFVSMYQGINLNEKQLLEHLPQEPNTYYGAFTSELEGTSYTMWTLVSNLVDRSTISHSVRVLRACLLSLSSWFSNFNFQDFSTLDRNAISFHLPLHRHFAILLSQAVAKQGLTLNEILPPVEILSQLIMHPLQLNIAFYEILNGLWVRNGLQIQIQAVTYVQFNFSNSMVDADFYLMQICATRIPPNGFLSMLIDRFNLNNWTSLSQCRETLNRQVNDEHDISMLTSFLSFLTTLVCLRTNLGLSDLEINRLEMATLLCIGDKTHSQLMESMPDRCGTFPCVDFEFLLGELATCKPPYFDSRGTMQQGMYSPKDVVWEKYYDPIYVMLRGGQRGDVQTAMKRFSEYYSSKRGIKITQNKSYWPPYRCPVDCFASYEDPRIVLQSKTFHAFAFIVLYNAVKLKEQELPLALIMFLLEMAVVTYCNNRIKENKTSSCTPIDGDLSMWYNTNCLVTNLKTEIGDLILTPTVEEETSLFEGAQSSASKMENKTNNNACTIKIDESLISLLLQIHSKLSGIEDSYNPDESEAGTSSNESNNENYVVEGPAVISKLLRKICLLDFTFRNYIQETRNKLWPPKSEYETLNIQKKKELEKERRRKQVQERHKKIMAQFNLQQKQFLKNMKTEDKIDMDWDSEEGLKSEHGYNCVICNQGSNSSGDEKTMGIVVYAQDSSVAGFQRRHGDRAVLPTSDEGWNMFRKDDTLIYKFEKRLEKIDKHFDPESWLLSINVGWKGGVFLHTCGHHIHTDCLESYQKSLPPWSDNSNISGISAVNSEAGEYLCPVCRQLSNAVLPLMPDQEDGSSQLEPVEVIDALNKLSSFYATIKNEPKSISSPPMAKAMEDITSISQMSLVLKWKNDKPEFETLFMCVASIVRTNLEVELIQRGGNLVSVKSPRSVPLAKRSCMRALLNMTALHARVLARWPVEILFQQISGIPEYVSSTLIREVPLLLQDPTAVFLQFLLLLPLNASPVYFTTLVKIIYNFLYYQVISQLFCGLKSIERSQIVQRCEGDVNSLRETVSLVADLLSGIEGDVDGDHLTNLNITNFEEQVQQLCLPFLRISALLKHHIFNQNLPEVVTPESEFVKLVYYLELVTESMDSKRFNAAVALNWPTQTELGICLPRLWCQQLLSFINENSNAAKFLLIDQHVVWHRPKLLQLPIEYDKFFMYYRPAYCDSCHRLPVDTGVCLICGTLVYLKRPCCEEGEHTEAIEHYQECGACTGIFLGVTSTCVFIMHRGRVCIWGSPYLDVYAEEDRDLKRGKPLHLCAARYRLLEEQWLSHRLDLIKNSWMWHTNTI